MIKNSSLTLLMIHTLSCVISLCAFGQNGENGEPLSLLERHNAVLSYNVSYGETDNAYLIPSNTVSDSFVNATVDTETRKEINSHSAIYLALLLETKQYLSETEASEIFASLFTQYSYSLNQWTVGLENLAIYEDYRLFDEYGTILFSGDYKAWSDNLRVFLRRNINDNLETEIGGAYRLKDYLESDYDHDMSQADLLLSWNLRRKTYIELFFAYSMTKYADQYALYEYGDLDDTSPLLQLNEVLADITITHNLPHEGAIRIFAQYSDTTDTHIGEGSYSETGAGLSLILQLFSKYALESRISLFNRNYEIRRLWENNALQNDDFMAGSITLERMIHGTLSGYLAYETSTRDVKTTNTEDYDENIVSFGLKHML